MLTADILRHSPTVLTLAERQRFFEDGFLLVPDAVDANWLSRLRAASEELVAASGDVRVSDAQFVLEAGHSPTQPKLRRLSSPVSHHRAFWDFAATSVSADIAADVCGPDLKFYHSKLNYKWPDGGQRFDWHQDIPAWPHTDYSPVSIGVY